LAAETRGDVPDAGMSAMGRSPDLQRRPITGGQRPRTDIHRPDLAALKQPVGRLRSCFNTSGSPM